MGTSNIPENQTTQEAAQKATPQAALASESWLQEISAANKWMEKWKESGRKIVKRYLDRRDQSGEDENKINIFTTNTQILIATLYAKFPKPLVTREYEDQDDDVARVASEVIERCVKIRPRDDFDSAMHYVVQDRLVPGAGSIWLRYEVETQPIQIPAVILPDGREESPASIGQQIVNEAVAVDYVFWEDLLWSPARTWENVRWVARRVKMSKADAEKRFGQVIASALSYKGGTPGDGVASAGSEAPSDDVVQYAEIYEIWCKRTKSVYWVSKGVDTILDKKGDLLGLDNFFPMPRPIMATTSTSNLIPRPDYLLVQDQYEELDMVNNRITKLERAIKAVGVYDGTNSEIEQIFSENKDNVIIPSRSFSEFMQAGGFKGAMDWVPIEMFVNALDKLRQYRQDLISQIYELTGISDIMRGSSKASETLGAQQLKAQYGSVKLQFLQMEVAGFVEEALSMKAQVISNKFQPQTILQMTNIERTPDKDFVPQAIQLIKSKQWKYRIEVHADSMAVPEFNAERDGRMGFIRALAEMLTAAAPVTENNPQAAAGLMEVVKWASASFRSARTIEGVLDKMIIQLQKQASAPPPPPPPPTPKEQSEIQRNVSAAKYDDAKAAETVVDTQIAAGIIIPPPPPAEPTPPTH